MKNQFTAASLIAVSFLIGCLVVSLGCQFGASIESKPTENTEQPDTQTEGGDAATEEGGDAAHQHQTENEPLAN